MDTMQIFPFIPQAASNRRMLKRRTRQMAMNLKTEVSSPLDNVSADRAHDELKKVTSPNSDPLHRFVPPQFIPFKRAIRKPELRKIVPLADTTIYEMEQRGEFPRRFYLTPRCVVWALAEVEAWLEERQRASTKAEIPHVTGPDVKQRKTRPVRG